MRKTLPTLARLGSLATTALALGACSAANAPNAPTPAMSASSPSSTPAHATLTVPELLAQAAQLKGKTVTLAGSYAGWTGPCRGGPPVSRSDWMIEDKASQSCVYASGPQPQGIPMPPQPASLGLPLRVTGEVALTADGRPYLRVPAKD